MPIQEAMWRTPMMGPCPTLEDERDNARQTAEVIAGMCRTISMGLRQTL